MDIIIKPMETESEIRGKAYVAWKSWHEAYPGLVSGEFLDKMTLEKCEKMAFGQTEGFLVAKDGARVIGFLGYGDRGEEAPDTGEIFALYVLSEYYGTGVGRKLMEAGLQKLRHYPKITLWVLKENKRAIRFYQKCGFVPTGEEMFSTIVSAAEIRMVYPRNKGEIDMDLSEITVQSRQVMRELLERASLTPGGLVVVGCSSSEVAGGVIGHASSFETAQAVLEGLYPEIVSRGLFLAAQCCEHLNRALIVERRLALQRGYEIVCVVPKPKAGGSFATAAWGAFEDPVAVEHVAAEAGLDIGLTLIGMHLRSVAVPVRLSADTVGAARITAALTRPKYIGGARAQYE